ncbi:unnamed protein product [Paramecium sonneborni]|uniref:Uncharacterized protein n=1 Tax=Paramecium sonneborni TaxID=65129 RepID=A0A8S1M8H6_9CILI|nr:unnamed protein product [Paramecium sonneborni]
MKIYQKQLMNYKMRQQKEKTLKKKYIINLSNNQMIQENYLIEKKERETKEEEIVESLREISGRIQEQLKKTRTEREKTEETLVQLVEKVIEKLKREMLEMNL